VQLNKGYEQIMRVTTGCFRKKINSFFRKKEGHNCTISGNKWFTEEDWELSLMLVTPACFIN